MGVAPLKMVDFGYRHAAPDIARQRRNPYWILALCWDVVQWGKLSSWSKILLLDLLPCFECISLLLLPPIQSLLVDNPGSSWVVPCRRREVGADLVNRVLTETVECTLPTMLGLNSIKKCMYNHLESCVTWSWNQIVPRGMEGHAVDCTCMS